jgi:hypothetical protein
MRSSCVDFLTLAGLRFIAIKLNYMEETRIRYITLLSPAMAFREHV